MSNIKLKSIPEVAKETLKRYIDVDMSFYNCVIEDEETKDSISFYWFLENLENDYKKHLEEYERQLKGEGEQKHD